jgi:hypothetical protein
MNYDVLTIVNIYIYKYIFIDEEDRLEEGFEPTQLNGSHTGSPGRLSYIIY